MWVRIILEKPSGNFLDYPSPCRAQERLAFSIGTALIVSRLKDDEFFHRAP